MELSMGSISLLAWGWLALSFLAGMLIDSWPYLRSRYPKLGRGLRRLPEHPHDHAAAMEEKPCAPDWGKILLRGLRVALEVGVPVVILDLLIDSRLVLLIFMAAFLPALINPRLARGLTGEAPRDHRPNVYPREAKIGFLVGIATLGLVIAYVALVSR